MEDIEFLQIESDSQRGEYMDMVEKLRVNPGWKLLCAKLKRRKEMIEEDMYDISSFQIGTEARDTGNELKYTDRDILAIQRFLLDELLEFPDSLIASLRKQKEFPSELNFDPFSDAPGGSVNPDDLEGTVL